jgi:hypothetical protein
MKNDIFIRAYLKNIIKEQIDDDVDDTDDYDEGENDGSIGDMDRDAPFYDIEISIHSYSDMASEYFDSYSEAIEQSEKDYAFFSQFHPHVLHSFSTPGGFGWIYHFTIPRERLLEFAKYPLFGDESNGLVFTMTDTGMNSNDITEETTLDDLFDAMVINDCGFDGHFKISPSLQSKQIRSAPSVLKKFKACLADLDEEDEDQFPNP